MNDDLISRAALQKSMAAVVFKNVPVEHQLYMQVVCDAFEHLVIEAPAVDAEPVRHGRWVPTEIRKSFGTLNGFKCSLCDKERMSRENYCPNCGAKNAEVNGDE